jgi:hypothetical protein
MSTSAETARNVLRSWIACEVLSPQITKGNGWSDVAGDRGGRIRNRKTDTDDGPNLWQPPEDGDPTPWPILTGDPTGEQRGPQDPTNLSEFMPTIEAGNPTDRKLQAWYSVILAAMPAGASFERLDDFFDDEADEDQTSRPLSGFVIAASVVLDEWGITVPDSLAISSFCWGFGHLSTGGTPDDLCDWSTEERGLKLRFADLLAPRGAAGQPRSLTWVDLRGVSRTLVDELGIPDDLRILTPCVIEMVRPDPPAADILSSFYLSDLTKVLGDLETETMTGAVASYLGINPPIDPWDCLNDRPKLSQLLDPGLFPLGRWPGNGLHPLTLLQQAAVNAIARDLDTHGLAAVNGPPGTGKTTLLRDVVAHVIITRAERLAAIESPWIGLGDIELMDYAIVVASSNNAAVENISLELPVREKALDASIWNEGGLDYFGHTATALLNLSKHVPDAQRAWGLIAARLGNAENRRQFFETFWWNKDWGLNDWFKRLISPDLLRPDPPGELVRLDPPLRPPEAKQLWRKTRAEFLRALATCSRLRAELVDLAQTAETLRCCETRLPSFKDETIRAQRDQQSARRAVLAAREHLAQLLAEETTLNTRLMALTAIKPSWVSRQLKIPAWRTHETTIRRLVDDLGEAADAVKAARINVKAATDEEERLAISCAAIEASLKGMEDEVALLSQKLIDAGDDLGVSCPTPEFWSQPDDSLYQSSPWNGGRFRTARDALFMAAIRLQRAFIVAGASKLKPSLNVIAKAASGGPDAPRPSARDWGVFFLLVPVVSSTFASMGRMFKDFGAESIGWLMIDEAGQAAPQQAVGAIWRARRTVVIGDPLQIEPITSIPPGTMQLIFKSHGLDAVPWSAPRDSVQTLADRASPIQGRFPLEDGIKENDSRVTGIPLLVHRRCDQPMFDISNRIAYAGRMVFATEPGPAPIRDLLGGSAWIDVDAPSSDKWVHEEGVLIAQAIAELCNSHSEPPDLYVISPFRIPATRLRSLLLQTGGILPGRSRRDREAWVEKRVGTVHTFQGKEAEAVILMLGAGRGAKPGSRSWAGGTPNLLNVAATRAKRAIYVVGNRQEWRGVGVFGEAAHQLDVRNGHQWLNDALARRGPDILSFLKSERPPE